MLIFEDKKKNQRQDNDMPTDQGEKGGAAEYDEDLENVYGSNEPDEADIMEDDRL